MKPSAKHSRAKQEEHYSVTMEVFKVLDYLIGLYGGSATKKHIIEETGVSLEDLDIAIKTLIQLDAITKIGGTYAFNKNTYAGKVFQRYDSLVLKHLFESEERKQRRRK